MYKRQRQHFVQGAVLGRVQRTRIEVGEGVVTPSGRATQSPAHGHGHRPGVEPHHGHRDAQSALGDGPGQVGVDRGGQLADAGVDAQAGQGAVDDREGIVGLEEEVATHPHSGQVVVSHPQVDDDQLAAGHFVLTMEPLAHGGQARRQPPPPPAAANGGVLTNSDERADTEHLP